MGDLVTAERLSATQASLFAPELTGRIDHERTGGLDVVVDEDFGSARRIWLDEHSWVDHVHGWLSGDDELMRYLTTNVGWEQRSRWMYDRRVQEPRLTAEYPMIDDAPAEKLDHAVIPVLSLGATRRFLVKPNAGGRSKIFEACGGDLIVMGGRCQRDHKHSVPKQKTATGPRVSLNFSGLRA